MCTFTWLCIVESSKDYTWIESSYLLGSNMQTYINYIEFCVYEYWRLLFSNYVPLSRIHCQRRHFFATNTELISMKLGVITINDRWITFLVPVRACRNIAIPFGTEKIRMVWLPGSETSLMTCLAVSTEYVWQSDGRTNRRTSCNSIVCVMHSSAVKPVRCKQDF